MRIVAAMLLWAAACSQMEPVGRPGAGDGTSRTGGERAGKTGGERADRAGDDRAGGAVRRDRDTFAEARSARRSKPKRGRRAEGEGNARPKHTEGGAARRVVLVARAVDGDTIEVERAGSTVAVRLIGIDTPETVHPSEPVECYGRAASHFTTESLEGRRVGLRFDEEHFDQYERLLAYVFIDGALFNHTLVARGYAEVSTYYPNKRYEDRLLAAEAAARRAARGMWGACPAAGSTVAGAATGDPAGKDAGSGADCDPNYSGTCVPLYPPDVDCTEVSGTNFASTGSDPHGFDGDADGVACE